MRILALTFSLKVWTPVLDFQVIKGFLKEIGAFDSAVIGRLTEFP